MAGPTDQENTMDSYCVEIDDRTGCFIATVTEASGAQATATSTISAYQAAIDALASIVCAEIIKPAQHGPCRPTPTDAQRARYARRCWAAERLGAVMTPETAHTPMALHGPEQRSVCQQCRQDIADLHGGGLLSRHHSPSCSHYDGVAD
jgi:hypothetical protein